MESTYTERTQLVLLAIFIHYLGYFIILILDSLDYPKRVNIRYGIKNILCSRKDPAKPDIVEDVPLTQRPLSNLKKPPLEEEPKFVPHETKYTKLVKGHYLKNNFFFFVGCICAIISGSKEYCLGLIYAVLGMKLLEIIGLSIGFLWLCYVCHLGCAVVNYANILNAINHYANEYDI